MKKYILLPIVLFFVSVAVFAQDENKRTSSFNLANNVALQGYDPVAYFKETKAVKGKKEYAAKFKGVTYYFYSASNKQAFLEQPSSYEPQYGGWCAFAMGESGEKVDVDPETFKIVDGKLYLFYNKFFNNTLKDWNKNEATLKKKADANWKKF